MNIYLIANQLLSAFIIAQDVDAKEDNSIWAIQTIESLSISDNELIADYATRFGETAEELGDTLFAFDEMHGEFLQRFPIDIDKVQKLQRKMRRITEQLAYDIADKMF